MEQKSLYRITEYMEYIFAVILTGCYSRYLLESIRQTKQTNRQEGTTMMMFSGGIFHCDFSLIA